MGCERRVIGRKSGDGERGKGRVAENRMVSELKAGGGGNGKSG